MAALSYLATRSNKAEAESNLLLLKNVEALADDEVGSGEQPLKCHNTIITQENCTVLLWWMRLG